jgi:hypothetical protein
MYEKITDMWCAQFKSAFRTFDLSQPVLYCLDKIRTCGLSATHMCLLPFEITNEITNVRFSNVRGLSFAVINIME